MKISIVREQAMCGAYVSDGQICVWMICYNPQTKEWDAITQVKGQTYPIGFARHRDAVCYIFNQIDREEDREEVDDA